MKYVAILLGGSMGTVFRYALSIFPHRYIDTIIPLGTSLVNILGSFIIGFLWAMTENANLHPNIKLFIFTGFIGAFTTFSTYIFETFKLLQNGETKIAILNLLINPLLGLIFVVLGYIIATKLAMLGNN